MSLAPLTQRTEESSTFQGKSRLSFGRCFLPEWGQGVWLKDSLGPLGVDSWAGQSEAHRVSGGRPARVPFPALDSVNVYNDIAVLSKLYTVCSYWCPSHSILTLHNWPNIISSAFQSVHCSPSPSPLPSLWVTSHPMTAVTSGPGPVSSPASSHPKCTPVYLASQTLLVLTLVSGPSGHHCLLPYNGQCPPPLTAHPLSFCITNIASRLHNNVRKLVLSVPEYWP